MVSQPSFAYIQLENPHCPLKKKIIYHIESKFHGYLREPKCPDCCVPAQFQTCPTESLLDCRSVHLSRSASPRVAVSSRPSPHPRAVVMQIQSFFKRTHLRKQCQAFGTNHREQACLPAPGSAPPPVALPLLQPPFTVGRRFP